MTATEIVNLLKAKHGEDVFIPECKDGPSAGTRSFRLDGWAMQKSWSRPTTYGYEIKVSRSDFLNDDKWQNYLELCSDFYFVCPHGLIQPQEVGEQAGLLWVAQTGTRLWTKKKAPRREVQIPETMWRYILMRLDSEGHARRFRADRWKEWLERRDETLHTGRNCGRRLREIIAKKIDEAECRAHELERRIAKLEALEKTAEKLGINLYAWDVERELRDKLARKAEIVTPETMSHLKIAQQRLGEIIKALS